MKKIEEAVNCYRKAYTHLIQEYQEKGNEIIEQFR